jgi:hypothetical protein
MERTVPIAQMGTAYDFWAPPEPDPSWPQLGDAFAALVRGGPAPVEPDLQATQMGAQIEPGQTRRPNVLPFTRDAQTGELQFAMPRLFDIMNNGLPSAAGSGIAPAAVRAGETMLGSGPIRAYHGSPQTELKELRPSERGPFGPAAYLSPAEQVAQRYARGGRVYETDIEPSTIFDGMHWQASSDVNPYQVWRDQTAKLVEAAEPEMKQSVAELASRMDPRDGYPFYTRLAQLYRSDSGAQDLLKRAGFRGIAGHVDGPEIAIFDPLQVGRAE